MKKSIFTNLIIRLKIPHSFYWGVKTRFRDLLIYLKGPLCHLKVEEFGSFDERFAGKVFEFLRSF